VGQAIAVAKWGAGSFVAAGMGGAEVRISVRTPFHRPRPTVEKSVRSQVILSVARILRSNHRSIS
jgi:hypothetical protein